MVIAARRAYADLIRWIKRARPSTFNGWRLARRLFWSCVVGATLLLGTIGLLQPARFGSRTGRFQAIEWWALAALLAICVVALVVRRTRLYASATRLRDTFRGNLEQHPSFAPAVSALDSCPAPFRTRFALGWVWGPAGLMMAGAIGAASAIYFVIDAILARGTVAPEQVVLAAVNALVSLVILRLAASRLSVWRLSYAVHRAATRL